MNSRFIVLSALLGGASLLTSTGAHASPVAQPGVSGIDLPVSRIEPNGVSADDPTNHPHPAGVSANVIDLEDCDADLAFNAQLEISNLSDSYNLNAWVGSQDCSELSNRATSATAVCWPVTELEAVSATPFNVRVRMRDIVSQAFNTTDSVVYVPAPNATTDATGALCRAQAALGPEKSLSLYFFFTDSGGNPVGTTQAFPITVDLVDNPAPSPVQTSGGSGCTVASRSSSPSTAFTLALAVGAVAFARRRRRATGTRRGWASRSSSRSA